MTELMIGFLFWSFILSPLWLYLSYGLFCVIRDKRKAEKKRIEAEKDYQERLKLPIDLSNPTLKYLKSNWHIVAYLDIQKDVLDDPIVKKGIRFLKLKYGQLKTDIDGMEHQYSFKIPTRFSNHIHIYSNPSDKSLVVFKDHEVRVLDPELIDWLVRNRVLYKFSNDEYMINESLAVKIK